MSDELTTTNKALVCADVTSTYEGLPAMQNQLLAWAKDKHAEVKAEHATLQEAYEEAKIRKWKASTLSGAARKCLVRLQFYDKVIAALEAGYMLFPPIDQVEVIAMRTEYQSHPNAERIRLPTYASSPGEGWDSSTEAPPLGEGEYKSPRVRWYRAGKVKDSSGSELQEWGPEKYGFDNPEFPLVMARVQCIEATTSAMEQKFFDDIAIYPARARKDPVIIGRIHDPKGRIMNFLVSWRIDKRDI